MDIFAATYFSGLQYWNIWQNNVTCQYMVYFSRESKSHSKINCFKYGIYFVSVSPVYLHCVYHKIKFCLLYLLKCVYMTNCYKIILWKKLDLSDKMLYLYQTALSTISLRFYLTITFKHLLSNNLNNQVLF